MSLKDTNSAYWLTPANIVPNRPTPIYGTPSAPVQNASGQLLPLTVQGSVPPGTTVTAYNPDASASTTLPAGRILNIVEPADSATAALNTPLVQVVGDQSNRAQRRLLYCVNSPKSAQGVAGVTLFANDVAPGDAYTVPGVQCSNVVGLRLTPGIHTNSTYGYIEGCRFFGLELQSSGGVTGGNFTIATALLVRGVTGGGGSVDWSGTTAATVIGANIVAVNDTAGYPAATWTGIQCAAAGTAVTSTAARTVIGANFNGVAVPSTVTGNAAIAINTPPSGSGTVNAGIWFRSNSTGTSNGVVFGSTGDTSFWRGTANQLLTQGDWSSRHYLSSSTPTVAAGAAAGTGPTISITGTDHGFKVTLTTGTSTTTNATLFTVTFGAGWTSSAPAVTCSEGNSATASLAVGARPFVSAVTTSAMTFTSGGTALAASTAYIWRFTAMR